MRDTPDCPAERDTGGRARYPLRPQAAAGSGAPVPDRRWRRAELVVPSRVSVSPSQVNQVSSVSVTSVTRSSCPRQAKYRAWISTVSGLSREWPWRRVRYQPTISMPGYRESSARAAFHVEGVTVSGASGEVALNAGIDRTHAHRAVLCRAYEHAADLERGMDRSVLAYGFAHAATPHTHAQRIHHESSRRLPAASHRQRTDCLTPRARFGQ